MKKRDVLFYALVVLMSLCATAALRAQTIPAPPDPESWTEQQLDDSIAVDLCIDAQALAPLLTGSSEEQAEAADIWAGTWGAILGSETPEPDPLCVIPALPGETTEGWGTFSACVNRCNNAYSRSTNRCMQIQPGLPDGWECLVREDMKWELCMSMCVFQLI